MKMTKLKLFILSIYWLSLELMAITPTVNVLQEIYFGVILPSSGGCRMIASTGAIISNNGLNTCILPEDSQNGLYTITANPNKIIRVSVQPNQDNDAGIIFNPFIELVSEGFVTKIIFNNTGEQTINSGVDGIVDLYLGGDLLINTTYGFNKTIPFSFLDAIVWSEDP
ncbi:MAG: hypothetical protein ACJAWT_001094 [Glaciecola sp.]|jgi:hypothetical protein